MQPAETPPLPQNIDELRQELAGAVPAVPAPIGMVGFYEGKLVVLSGVNKQTIQRVQANKDPNLQNQAIQLRTFSTTNMLRDYLRTGERFIREIPADDPGGTPRIVHRATVTSEGDIETTMGHIDPSQFIDLQELVAGEERAN